MSLFKDYDSPLALDILRKGEVELLQPFREIRDRLLREQNHPALPRHSISKLEKNGGLECLYDRLQRHWIAVIRSLVEFSNHTKNCFQHSFDEEFKAIDNANLFGHFFDIVGSKAFGDFDQQKLCQAFSKSKLFPNVEPLEIAGLTREMIASLPIGYSQDLNLPVAVLDRLGYEQVKLIHFQIVQIYHQSKSLQRSENDILVLLTWSSIDSRAQRVLSEWAASDAGCSTYRRMISDVRNPQTVEQLGLTLVAILCYHRLLPFTSTECTQPVNGSYLGDFDALLNGKPTRNERAVSERMVFSLLRVLDTDTLRGQGQEIRQFITTILDQNTPVLDLFDGFSDKYIVYRASGQTHEDAFKMAGLPSLMGTMTTTDVEDWITVINLG